MKRSNLTTSIFLSLIIILMASCSKDPIGENNSNNTALGTISATIHGEKFASKTGIASLSILQNNTDVLLITGSEEPQNIFTNSMILYIYNDTNGDIMSETYDNNEDCSEGSVCLNIIYYDLANETVYSSDNSNFKLSINSIAYKKGGHVNGSFSGFIVNSVTDDIIEINDGKFNVRISD